MSARCGCEGCDCEYTIAGLLRRLEMLAEQCLETVRDTRADTENPMAPCEHGLECACYEEGYQAGYETERRPMGA